MSKQSDHFQDKQKLIDICFSIALTINSDAWLPKTSEETAEWVRKQLAACGFRTVPVGASWGTLIKNKEERETENV